MSDQNESWVVWVEDADGELGAWAGRPPKRPRRDHNRARWLTGWTKTIRGGEFVSVLPGLPDGGGQPELAA
jgi:hypothetical protein